MPLGSAFVTMMSHDGPEAGHGEIGGGWGGAVVRQPVSNPGSPSFSQWPTATVRLLASGVIP